EGVTIVAIGYVDGARFRRSLLAAADWVAAGRDELNRINVFPVPDGDTGTNMRTALRPHGGSIVILTTGDLLKAHIHTDAPDAVFKLASTWGTLESTKADDMRAQHRAYRDRLELTPGEFFRRLRTGHDASTSQPAPQAFADAYKDAA